jgi:hypothetical protein
MLKRLIAIVFIFLCTTAAWMILGSTVMDRTYSSEPDLRDKVASSWGSAQVQLPPSFTYTRAMELVKGEAPLPVESTRIDADLNLDYRQKGLLWYSTYLVSFAGTYEFRNDTDEDRDVHIHWPFPSQKALYDDMVLSVNDAVLPFVNKDGVATASIAIPAGKAALCRIAYRSHGLDSWAYSLGTDVAQVRNFRLQLTTNFRDVDFPENALSPSVKAETPQGWRLTWDYRNVVSGYQIAVAMPARLQPGPLAGEISYFAPVSLFFFFFVMLMVTTLRRIELHPMNYFFLAAAFFAFHLLLAYLVDHISVHAAFLIASLVSTGLVVSYLRLVTGLQFAAREAGLAQFLYLVLFSYAFFFRGFTGLAITLGSIVTLFVAMQITGRVRWAEFFGERRLASPAEAGNFDAVSGEVQPGL